MLILLEMQRGASRLRSGMTYLWGAGPRRRLSLLALCHMRIWCNSSQLGCAFSRKRHSAFTSNQQTLGSHFGTRNAFRVCNSVSV